MSWVCHIWPLLCWGSFPLCPLSRLFLIINQWILLKAFYASAEMNIWFLFFSLLIWWITLIDLYILKNAHIPRINSTWLWYMILLMCCWILFSSVLLRIFMSVFINIWPIIFFFYDIFVWFWYQGDGGLLEWAWECSSPSAVFWKSLRRMDVSSSLNIW